MEADTAIRSDEEILREAEERLARKRAAMPERPPVSSPLAELAGFDQDRLVAAAHSRLKGSDAAATPACELCDGRGFVIERDAGNGTARPCSCRTSPPVEDLLRRSRMQPREIVAALEPWDAGYQPYPAGIEAWAMAKAQDSTAGPWAFVLLSASAAEGDELRDAGAPGRGKTKASAMALRRWCELTGKPGLWINLRTDMRTVMEERHRDGVSELEARILRFPGLVVLDECGGERGTETHSSALTEWMYRRHRDWSPTIINGNAASPDQLGDGRIASRLGEAEIRYLVASRDYRDLRAEVTA